MATYHVSNGVFGILCGTVKKNGTEWLNKNECTDEALEAVRDYLYRQFIKDGKTSGGFEWTRQDGKIVRLMVDIREGEKENV